MMEQEEAITGAARERFCKHHRTHPPGSFYSGTELVAALQILKAEAAVRAAGNVEAFFWNDAPLIKVWLCHDCAGTLALRTE